MNTFNHSGDFGDIVYAMRVIKELGGGRVLLSRNGKTREPMNQSNVGIISPLMLSQSYISSASYSTSPEADIDFNDFRPMIDRRAVYGKKLGAYYADVCNVDPAIFDDGTPWITAINKSTLTSGKVVINRTNRYRNNLFPWKDVLKLFYGRCCFIGTPAEHSEFCSDHGAVSYIPTKTLLEAAELIAGADWFVGNQSCCYAIAEAMKCNVIQETCIEAPDCRFVRPGSIIVIGSYLDIDRIKNEA